MMVESCTKTLTASPFSPKVCWRDQTLSVLPDPGTRAVSAIDMNSIDLVFLDYGNLSSFMYILAL